MIKEKLMNLIKTKDVDDKNKRKIENIVVFIVILIITIIAINMIWNSEEEKGKSNITNSIKVLAEENSDESTIETNSDSLENKLENILKEIKGVGKVKVLITYSQTSETLAMYNEDTSQSSTEESDTRRRK